MLYLLPAGGWLAPVNLNDEFTSDGIIIFRSPTLDLNSDGASSINLHNSDGDTVLHIVFRRKENKIVCLTLMSNVLQGRCRITPLFRVRSLFGVPRFGSRF